MNRLFKWLTKSAANSAMEKKHIGNSLIAFHASGNPVWSAFQSHGFEKNGFCTNPIVYRCVRMVSEAAASIPWLVNEDGKSFDYHPALDVLQKPNERQSGTRFLETLFGHLLISGNAYVTSLLVDDVIQELHILDPAAVTSVNDENGWPVAYEFSVGSTRNRYNASGIKPEIVQLGLFNPVNDANGMSPLAAAHMALDIHNAASSWNKALLDNSARPSGALVYASSAGDNLTDEQFSRLKEELEEGYTGAMRAGRPMVLEGGLDWKAMGYSPRDMDFLEAKNGAAREIALAFGVPPMLLGIPGDNTYSNYQEANRAFWRQTVLPLANRTANDLSVWLTNHFETQFKLQIDADQIDALACDREALWARIGSAEFLTTNEKREVLGYGALTHEEMDEVDTIG